MPAADLGSSPLSRAQQRALVTALAEALSKTLSTSWTVADDRYGVTGRWELHEAGGVQLWILLGQAQAAVRGIHEQQHPHGPRPFHIGLRRPTIRFSLAKAPHQIAADVVGRLLPAVRHDAHVLAHASWHAELSAARRLRTLRRASELLAAACRSGGLAWVDGDVARPSTCAEATAHGLAGLNLTIELTDDYGTGGEAAVTVSHLTHTELLTVIAAVAAMVEARTAPS